MTHRREVVWLDVADTAADVRRKIADTGYSRFLICDGDLDKLLGYVRTRAIVDRLLDGAPLDLRSMVREPLSVPTSARSSCWRTSGGRSRILR
jgi:putative hemolysin